MYYQFFTIHVPLSHPRNSCVHRFESIRGKCMPKTGYRLRTLVILIYLEEKKKCYLLLKEISSQFEYFNIGKFLLIPPFSSLQSYSRLNYLYFRPSSVRIFCLFRFTHSNKTKFVTRKKKSAKNELGIVICSRTN